MNSLVTALPGLVPIFVSAGGVNALADVLFSRSLYWVFPYEVCGHYFLTDTCHYD